MGRAVGQNFALVAKILIGLAKLLLGWSAFENMIPAFRQFLAVVGGFGILYYVTVPKISGFSA